MYCFLPVAFIIIQSFSSMTAFTLRSGTFRLSTECSAPHLQSQSLCKQDSPSSSRILQLVTVAWQLVIQFMDGWFDRNWFNGCEHVLSQSVCLQQESGEVRLMAKRVDGRSFLIIFVILKGIEEKWWKISNIILSTSHHLLILVGERKLPTSFLRIQLSFVSDVAKKKSTAEGEIVQGDSLSKDARSEVLSGVLSQIERSYGKGIHYSGAI